MTIAQLIDELSALARKSPHNYDTQVVAWVRVPNAGESAVLEVSSVSQGYREELGGTIATINLDSKV